MLRPAIALLTLATLASACTRPHLDVSAFLARVEAHMEAHPETLASSLSHLALLEPLGSATVVEALRAIDYIQARPGYVLGAGANLEPHGGGILALLVDHWRPKGRKARLEDTFLFRPTGRALALHDLYEGYKRQLVRAEPVTHASLRGWPRLRFRLPRERTPREMDTYHVLRLLIAFELDPEVEWTTEAGETLRLQQLIDDLAIRLRNAPVGDARIEDHGDMHGIELLLAYATRYPSRIEINEIATRFLDLVLDHPSASTEIMAHDVESIGRLREHPAIVLSASQLGRIDRWLRRLDSGGFTDLRSVPPAHLAHLLTGLRRLAATP